MRDVVYYPFTGHVLNMDKSTRNRTVYGLEFGENVVRRMKESKHNIGGWLGHYNSDPTKGKLLFLHDKFKVDGSRLYAEGYIKYDDDTASLLDDVKNGFAPNVPVSIASKILGYKEVRDVDTGRVQIVFTDGDVLRIDACDVPASDTCGVVPDFSKPLKQIPASKPSQTVNESANGGFLVMEGVKLEDGLLESLQTVTDDTKPLEEAGAALVPQGDATNTNTPTDENKVLESVAVIQEPKETSLKMPASNEQPTAQVTTQVPAQTQNESVGLASIFDVDAKKAQDAQYNAFIASQGQAAHDTRLESFRRGAANVYSADGVARIEGILDVMLESTAKALNLAPWQLDNKVVMECAQQARQRYMAASSSGGAGSTATRLESTRGSTSLLSPDFRLGDSVIQELNAEGSFKGRFDGVTWESVVKNPKARTFLINAMQENSHKIKREVDLFHTLQESYNTVVKPAREELEQHGSYSDTINPATLSTLRQIDGVKVESSTLDGDFVGSSTVYAELNTCIPTIITALCLFTNPLLALLKPMPNNHVVRHTFNICRPDNLRLVETEYDIVLGQVVDVVSTGILAVSVLDNTSGTPVWVELSSSYADDYITFPSGAQHTLSLMILDGSLFSQYGDGTTIRIKVGADPIADPCGVPILINVERSNEFVHGQHLRIAFPKCDIAMAAFVGNYGIDIVDEAFKVAISMIDQYWSDLLMAEIMQASNACFAAEVKQSLLTAQAQGTPYVAPERLMPYWNASSVPLFDGDNNTNGSYASLMLLAHSLRNKCNGLTQGATKMVIPVELRNLLTGWAISNQVNNQSGNMLAGNDSQVTQLANMSVITLGNCDIEQVSYTDANGQQATTSVYVGMVHLLGDNALHGHITRTAVSDEGQVSRVTTYRCDGDLDGSTEQQLIMPTQVKIQGLTAYGRFYADPQDVKDLFAGKPGIAQNLISLLGYGTFDSVEALCQMLESCVFNCNYLHLKLICVVNCMF